MYAKLCRCGHRHSWDKFFYVIHSEIHNRAEHKRATVDYEADFCGGGKQTNVF